MNRIKITREYAALDIASKRAQLRITTARPVMKVMRGSRARMVVERTAPKLRVNWNKVPVAPPIVQRQTIGQHHPNENYVLDIGSDRYYTDDKSHKKPTQQAQIRGNRLMRNRTSIVRHAAEQAKRSPLQTRQAAITAALEWELGSVNIDWEIERAQIEWSISRPTIEVEPYSLEIRMRNYPKLHITYNPDHIVPVMGRKLDKRV